MIFKKGGSQIENLTPDHKSLSNRGQMRSDWGVFSTVGKIFEGYTILPLHFQNRFDLRKI
jgi:hypothetical protein